METKTKRCRGPFHPPGGADVPIAQYTVNRTGPRAGKPLSRCKTCRSSGNSKTVPAHIFIPMLEKLLEDRTVIQVSQMVDLTPAHIQDLASGKRKRIYKQTFLNICRAYSSIPKEKVSIGPQNIKTKRNGLSKLTYEERSNLKKLISIKQKERYKKEKLLLKHVL